MSQVKRYEIGGKTYVQRPLVIGQLGRLLDELSGVQITSRTAAGLVAAFGPRLPRLLACVLVPEGTGPAEVDVDKLAEELAFAADPEVAIEVVEDFFALTPVYSYLDRLTGIMARAGGAAKTGKKNSSASSPEETSQNGK